MTFSIHSNIDMGYTLIICSKQPRVFLSTATVWTVSYRADTNRLMQSKTAHMTWVTFSTCDTTMTCVVARYIAPDEPCAWQESFSVPNLMKRVITNRTSCFTRVWHASYCIDDNRNDAKLLNGPTFLTTSPYLNLDKQVSHETTLNYGTDPSTFILFFLSVS